MSRSIKITHLTSAHQRYDTRIFLKMCSSLAKNENYKVYLVVADGKGDEIRNSVNIVDAGAKTGGRISRMTKTVKNVFEKAKELESHIYHLHDPELIPIGIKLKKLGKKVIFDAHEDLPKQLLNKPYLTKNLRLLLSKIFLIYEKIMFKRFDFIVAATPIIRDKILLINKNTIDINNFPTIKKSSFIQNWKNKKNEVCYVGGIDRSRGIYELVEAMNYTRNTVLNLAGNFKIQQDKEELLKHEGWKNVNSLGYLDKAGVDEVYKRSKIGLVTLHPQVNYIESLPVKMFEYMEAAIPVIASNFPIWKSIIEEYKCGICVDPLDPKEIGQAINDLIGDEDLAKNMGENGRRAILEHFNWNIEESKLYKLYNTIIDEI